MSQAARDQNNVPTLLAVSSVDGVTPVVVYANPTTHRLLVDSAGGGGTGTVTSVSVVSANGFAGTVATATTTPAITLTTTITGVLKGNGTAISAATAGTDYIVPTTSFTAGSIAFGGSSGQLNQDNTNFFWDNTNKQTLLGSGTSSLPAYSFTGDADTGIYRNGANDIRITAGGTVGVVATQGGGGSLRDSSGLNSVSAGSRILDTGGGTAMTWGTFGIRSNGTAPSATVPQLSFTADTNTGIFNPGTGLLAFTTAGVESARFDASQNFGIGTGTTVSARVHAISTTQQLRLGYDVSNYLSATVASTGSTTFALTGTSPVFTFSQNVTLPTLTTTANIELGNASDTTLSRSAAGVLAVEGVVIPSISSTNTLTNKRVTKRVVTTTQSATPTINTDNTDVSSITGLAQAITSFTTNLSGTPVAGDMLMIQITDNGTARGITWGTSFASTTVTLPTTTVISTMLRVLFQWNTVTSKWDCIGLA